MSDESLFVINLGGGGLYVLKLVVAFDNFGGGQCVFSGSRVQNLVPKTKSIAIVVTLIKFGIEPPTSRSWY